MAGGVVGSGDADAGSDADRLRCGGATRAGATAATAARVATSDSARAVGDESVDIDAVAAGLCGGTVERVAAHLVEEIDEVLVRFDFGVRVEELVEGGFRSRRWFGGRGGWCGLRGAFDSQVFDVDPAIDAAEECAIAADLLD